MSALPDDSPARARALRWAPVLVVVAALVAYHNSFYGPFVFDDASSITTNPTIRRLWPLTAPLSPPTSNVTAQGRPLLNLSLAINYAISGNEVWSYHALNLLIHAGAGLALFGLVRRTLLLPRLRGRYGRTADAFALAVALLWTAHPLQTESVTYVIQRAESLMGLFYLLTFYGFVRAVGSEVGRVSDPPSNESTPTHETKLPATGWLAFSVAACAAGMATKEVMATAPLMVFLYDRTFAAGTWREAWRRRPWFYVGLGVTWFLLGWLVLQTGGNRGGSVGFGVGVAWWDYWLTQFKAVMHYLRLAIWPVPLVFEYGAFWVTNLADIAFEAIVLLTLLGATIVGLWRRSVLGFLGAWFFGILAPTSLAPGTTQMIVEHRMYLSLAAVIIVIVAAVHAALTPRYARWSGWGLAAVVTAAIVLTVRRNDDYRTELTLWRDTIAKSPKNPLAHFMLAGAWERAGDPRRALASYEETLRLKSDFSVGRENLASCSSNKAGGPRRSRSSRRRCRCSLSLPTRT